MSDDLIRRQDAVDALWKAMYEYEDKTEKQFQESEDLDVGDWIEHRIFVQNMNDIDRQTILNLPSAQPEGQKSEWISVKDRLPELDQEVLVYAIGKADGFIGDSEIAISKRFKLRLLSSPDGIEEWKSPWVYFDDYYEITHWMPLPDAPKGEQ